VNFSQGHLLFERQRDSFDVAHFGFVCHWQKGQCTEAIYYDLVTYDLHRKAFIKAAEVGIVQHQTILRCSKQLWKPFARFVIPARKHWNGYRLANIPTAAVRTHEKWALAR
jgi:hypothetical protein